MDIVSCNQGDAFTGNEATHSRDVFSLVCDVLLLAVPDFSAFSLLYTGLLDPVYFSYFNQAQLLTGNLEWDL